MHSKYGTDCQPTINLIVEKATTYGVYIAYSDERILCYRSIAHYANQTDSQSRYVVI